MPVLNSPRGPFWRGSPEVDWEEATGRLNEVRQRANARPGGEMGERQRRILAWLGSALAIAVITYAAWTIVGHIAGLIVGVLLVLGALALWRLWT